MQTTLLGIAIAVILALLAALVGPIFIDWTRYRGELETRASRLSGLDFRITGKIDARLLPTPSLMLQGIEFGRPGESSKVRARGLHVEFALGALLRGEWRIEDARLDAPEFDIGLDSAGHVQWAVPSIGFVANGVSIQRLKIHGGRATLADAASDSRLVLDKFEFRGELRSLAGPAKGEGSFLADGHYYPYRFSMGRAADDGSVKLRLNIDPISRPFTAEVDVSVGLDRGAPRVEGSIAFGRRVGRAPEGSQALITEPWRITSRIKGDSRALVLEQIEFQHGPDERALKLRGDAKLTLGSSPQLDGVLSSPQIDLDRALALPEAARRRPLAAAKALADYFAGAQKVPFPVRLGLSIESLTLGGAMLQRLTGDVRLDGDSLDIESLELRAPGITQLRLSGRIGGSPQGMTFKGPAKIDSGDSRTFLAWLSERAETQAPAGSLRLTGDLSLGPQMVAVDQLKAEIDRMTVEGSFAYSWPQNGRPARLDATLMTPEINIDRVNALAAAMLGDTEFERPREGTLSLKVGHALFAGIEAKRADVNMRIDSEGIEIERFAVADFGGAALAVKGRIDTKSQPPRGAVTLDVDARSLAGVTALIEKIAPKAAEELRRAAGRLTPLALRGSLAFEPPAGAGAGANATSKFKLDGRAGVFRVALQGDGAAASDALKTDILAALAAATVNFSARLDADEGAALVDLVGLERFLAVDKRPGRLNVTAQGPLDGKLAIDGQLVAGALSIAASGAVNVSTRESPAAGLDIKIVNANVRSPRPVVAGRAAEFLPLSATLRLDVAEGTWRLADLKGTVAGAGVAGRLVIETQQQPISVDGELELGAVDLAGVIGTAIGVPVSSHPASLWATEPFDYGVSAISGQIAMKAARAALTPKLVARDLRSIIRVGESQLALQLLEANLAGGRATGELIFLREGSGLIARARVSVAGANAAELLPGDALLAGQLTFQVAAEGSGMSPNALMGSLEGHGIFTLTNGRMARLNPGAFDNVIRAVDRGMAVDATRVRERMDSALAGGSLTIRLAEGAITIEGGQARILSNPELAVPGADLVVNGRVNLIEGALDARLTLSGAPAGGPPVNARPEIEIALKGPIDSAKRTIDVTPFASWLALRAVEQQSKKLDMLETRDPAAASPSPNGSPPSAAASPEPVASPPLPAAPLRRPATVRPQSAPDAAASPSTEPPPVKPSPSSERAPALPPPIDIRPAPGSRTPRATRNGVAPTPVAPRAVTPPHSLFSAGQY